MSTSAGLPGWEGVGKRARRHAITGVLTLTTLYFSRLYPTREYPMKPVTVRPTPLDRESTLRFSQFQSIELELAAVKTATPAREI